MDRRNLQKYADGKWGVRVRLPVGYTQWEFKRKVGPIGEARRLRDEILVKIARREPLEPPATEVRRSFASVCEEWAELRPRSDVKNIAKLWGEWAGNRRPCEISRPMIQSAIDEMKKVFKPNTIKGRLGALSSIFTLAEEHGLMEYHQNPFRKKFRVPKAIAKDEAPTPEQVCRALIEMGEFAPLGEFAALTGLRRNELLYLEWPQVNWDRGEISLRETKNGKPHVLPLPRRCLEILEKQKDLGNTYCFPGPEGRKWNCTTHHKMWRPAFDRAGMTGFVWHDLRRAMATAAMAAGVELYTTSTLLNHSGTTVTKIYTHLPKETQRAALEKVSVYFSGTRQD